MFPLFNLSTGVNFKRIVLAFAESILVVMMMMIMIMMVIMIMMIMMMMMITMIMIMMIMFWNPMRAQILTFNNSRCPSLRKKITINTSR